MKPPGIRKASRVNLNKYLGKWYQIESYPAWFQNGLKDVTAQYVQKKGYIQVINKGKLGSLKQKIVGKAFATNKPNLLKVQFFTPFGIPADYKIEFVDTKYNYAVVGSSNKKYLWILSRDSKVEPGILKKLIKQAKIKGYDVSKLKE